MSSFKPRVARRAIAGLGSAALAAAALLAGGSAIVVAHVQEHAGPYSVEIGWLREPAYVDQPNAVQATINDAKGDPVLDLGPDDLKVVVSTGGKSTGALAFEAGFDPADAEGPLGEYDAAIVPTAPGEYSFHITGSIHGSALDVTVGSSDETFDPVVGSDDIEFPDQVPALNEVVTRLDRIDQRIAALPSGAGTADVQAAIAAAEDAKASADRAVLVGGALGVIGIVLAIVAVGLAMRRGRRVA
jgi:hypothetical protein